MKTTRAKSTSVVPAKKKAAPAPRTPRYSAAHATSLFLFTKLREDLGESQLSSILKHIRDEVRPITRIRVEEKDNLTRMRADNAARLAAKRAVILVDAVNSDDAGGFISRSRPIVNKLAKEGELLAVQDGRYLRFPRWQFDERSEDGLVRGLRRVLSVMDASPFRKAAWLVSPNPHFAGRAPIELLREGQLDTVYEEAKAITSG